jgi:hypothetical protein
MHLQSTPTTYFAQSNFIAHVFWKQQFVSHNFFLFSHVFKVNVYLGLIKNNTINISRPKALAGINTMCKMCKKDMIIKKTCG